MLTLQMQRYPTESEEMTMSDYLIETKQLTKMYGDQAAVKDVDLHVKKGHIYGLLGRNGAGKTTIMKMILGLTSITSGEVVLESGRINHSESDRNSQFELNRNSQCTLAN